MKNLRLLTASLLFMMLLVFRMPVVMAQDFVKVAPNICKVLLENDRVRVVQVVNKPGGKVAMHSHPPYIVYAFTSGKEKFTLPDGKTAEHEIKAGQAVWSERVTHSGQNVGTTELRLLVIELKK